MLSIVTECFVSPLRKAYGGTFFAMRCHVLGGFYFIKNRNLDRRYYAKAIGNIHEVSVEASPTHGLAPVKNVGNALEIKCFSRGLRTWYVGTGHI